MSGYSSNKHLISDHKDAVVHPHTATTVSNVTYVRLSLQKLRTPFDKWRFRIKRMTKNSRIFLKIFSEESLRFQRQIAEVLSWSV